MGDRISCPILVFVISSLALTLAAPAPAQDKPKDTKLLAEAYHEKALLYYQEDNFEKAIEYFLKAHDLVPNPFSLYNLARIYDEKLFKKDQAYLYYQKYLETGDKQKLEETRKAMAEIEKMPVILKVLTEPEGALVLIDGEEVADQRTPVIVEVGAGRHEVIIVMEGFEEAQETVDIPVAGSALVEKQLAAKNPPKKPEEGAGKVKKPDEDVQLDDKAAASRRRVSLSIGLAAGATVSTTSDLGSYINASLNIYCWIKRGFVGLAVDNMFFTDSYLMSLYPAGGYSVKVWKDLSIDFTAGFGFAYLYASEDGYGENDAVVVSRGSHWDLAAHADIRLGYAVGRVRIYAVPAFADVLLGVGNIRPAPLVQFAFLLGVAYAF
jgi:tetratricopeptide (TPR) repeat protein